MQMQKEQLALLQKAMETHKQVEAMQEVNSRLREKVQQRQEIISRLSKISLSTASLLNSVDITSKETEMSSLKCTKKLCETTAFTQEIPQNDDDQIKLIIGKYLNQLMVVLFDFVEQHPGSVDIFAMKELETKMSQLFGFAESKGIIPQTESADGWKRAVQLHQILFQKIEQMMQKEEQ